MSTPEVLERVGTVEAELVHLEGAIRDHANESTQVGCKLTTFIIVYLTFGKWSTNRVY